MVRVTVNEAMRVFPQGQHIELAAGQVVEGPIAAWLIDYDCPVTVEQDDRPAPADVGEKAAQAEGALSASLTASADVVTKGAKSKS